MHSLIIANMEFCEVNQAHTCKTLGVVTKFKSITNTNVQIIYLCVCDLVGVITNMELANEILHEFGYKGWFTY